MSFKHSHLPSLTPRQREVYAYLQHQQAQDAAHAPSLAEICRAMGLKSRGSLYKHIQALEAAGLVQAMGGLHRGVRLSAAFAPMTPKSLPLLGYIAAGHPLEAVTQSQNIAVPEQLHRHKNAYVLQVKGDSMVDEGIHDGDYIVVEQREQARNGEIVVALLDQSEVTLKRIEQTPRKVVLHPANPQYAPLQYAPERVQIQGVLLGLMRVY